MPHSIKILREGISSSFQDLGRYNVQYLGIGPSGCMDDDNFKLCNAILHNDENEGMIEFAYQGPKIQIDQATVKICVTGNVLFTISNTKGEVVQGQCYRSYYLVKGDVIDIQSVKDSVYGYLGFEGGINLKQYFQSISVNPRSKIGPNNGEKIKNGDLITLKQSEASKNVFALSRAPENKKKSVIRVLEGPQLDYFSNEGIHSFFHTDFKITNLTDRMGMRLEGKKVELIKSANIKSEGIIRGSIQVPADGQPIVLLSDHQTIGGYPKIGVVITADYNQLIQILPGNLITFRKVNIREAEISFQLKQASLKAMIDSIVKIN